MQRAKPSPRRANWPDISRYRPHDGGGALVGFALIALCVGGFGIWGSTVPIASAIVANGQVVVASKRRQIQHPTGGVIKVLHVEDGSVVKAGAVLLELEDADAADRYTRTRDSFFLALASEARLQAEALDRPAPDYSKELLTAAIRHVSVKSIIDGEMQMFNVRLSQMRGQF